MAPENEVSEATKEAETEEAQAPHSPDRLATKAEAEAADRSRTESRDGASVAEHVEEMAQIGAHVKGEGEIK